MLECTVTISYLYQDFMRDDYMGAGGDRASQHNVKPSTVKHDKGDKMDIYETSGV